MNNTDKSAMKASEYAIKHKGLHHSSHLFCPSRLSRHTRPSPQEAPVCLPLKWDPMPFACLIPSARRSVPVWMHPALEDVIGDYWRAVWALTGQICLTCLSVKGSFDHNLAAASSVDAQVPIIKRELKTE